MPEMTERVTRELWATWPLVPTGTPYGTKTVLEGLVIPRDVAERQWPGRDVSMYPVRPDDSYPSTWTDKALPVPVMHECGVCGKSHLTAERPWHAEASQQAHYQDMAQATGYTVEEVARRLSGKPDKPEKPDSSKAGQKPDGPESRTKAGQACARPGCGRPVHASTRGSPSRWCSEACRKLAARGG